MNTIRVVGIDIDKSVFQVCVWMNNGSVAWNKKISRSRLQDTVRQFEPGTLIAMEACSTSHFWGRTLSAIGYPVRLIPAQHVKAFVRSQKNDANDALAICETAFRPGIHFVSVKTTCKHTCFSSTHFLRVTVFQPSAGTLPASGCSGIHEAARCYIPSTSAR